MVTSSMMGLLVPSWCSTNVHCSLLIPIRPSCQLGSGAESELGTPSWRTQLAMQKKGLGLSAKPGAGFEAKAAALRPSWLYSWGSTPPQGIPAGTSFVPMVWGPRSLEEKLAPLTLPPGEDGVLLGFNEPDGEDQANMSVEEALAAWPLLEKTGRRLGSPACVHPDGEWMRAFMRGVEARGLRVDFVCVHDYRNDDADALIARLRAVHAAFRRPIWLTEFAVADWGAKGEHRGNRYTPERVLAYMRQVLPKLEALDCLERYAWFTKGAASVSLGTSSLADAEGALTPLGECYRSFQAPLRFHGTGASEAWAPQHSFFLYPPDRALVNAAWDTHSAADFCAHHRCEGPSGSGLKRFACLGHAPPAPGGPALILCVSGSGSSTYVARERARCRLALDADEAQGVLFAPSGPGFPPGWWCRDSDEDLRIHLRNLRCALADLRAPTRVGAYSASTLLAGARLGLLHPATACLVRVPCADHARNVAARAEREDATFKHWPAVAASRRGMVREALRAGLPVHASFKDAAARRMAVCARWDCDVVISRRCGHGRGPFCERHCVGTGAVCAYHSGKGLRGAGPAAVLLPPLPCSPAPGAHASYLYFPGTLNPVHAGHLALLRGVKHFYEHSLQAQWCQGRPLAAAFLVPGPSAWAESKGGAPVPTAAQRLEMCELATDGEPWLAVDAAVVEGAVPGHCQACDASSPFLHLRARIQASYGDTSPCILFPMGSDAFLRQPVGMLAFLAHQCGVATVVCPRGGDRATLDAHMAEVSALACEVRAALGGKADHLILLPPHKAWLQDCGGGRSSEEVRGARQPWELRSAVGIPAVARFIEAEGLYRAVGAGAGAGAGVGAGAGAGAPAPAAGGPSAAGGGACYM